MANRLPPSGYVLGLDIGDKRIGVALASGIARLPQPLETLPVNENIHHLIKELVSQHAVTLIVIGLPRNLEGEETAQSEQIRRFAADLAPVMEIPLVFVDESLSSKRADELMCTKSFKNISQDSLAACFILEEFFATMDKTNEGEL